jgi:hypothetical protein
MARSAGIDRGRVIGIHDELMNFFWPGTGLALSICIFPMAGRAYVSCSFCVRWDWVTRSLRVGLCVALRKYQV